MAAEPEFQRVRLPRLESVGFADFDLYKRQPNVQTEVDRPVFCLIGANGLGKSTFLNAVVYAVTGVIPDPNRAFPSADEYLKEASRPEAITDYFGGRITESRRPLSTITIKLAWEGIELQVTRRLAELPAIVRLTYRKSDGDSANIDLSEGQANLEARYRELVLSATGMQDYSQFVFLYHFVLTFDEGRHLMMWDDRVVNNALILAFGENPSDASDFSEKLREMENESSRARNVRFAAKIISDNMDRLADVLKAGTDAGVGEIELRERFDALNRELERTHSHAQMKEVERQDNDLQLADLSARMSDLQSKYRQLFSEHTNAGSLINYHPTIRATISQDSCAICGTSGVAAHVEAIVAHSNCPLCNTVLVSSASAKDSIAELKTLDANIGVVKNQINEVSMARERLKAELQAAQASEVAARAALSAFEDEHGLVSTPATGQDGDWIRREIGKMDAERQRLVKQSIEHRKKRDAIRATLRENERAIKRRYDIASKYFVPKFRELAQAFIGLPIDIKLEPRKGADTSGFSLRLHMDDKLRLQPDRLSESQRFFIDIALRMALSDFISRGPSTLFIDTPEGSLDIAYEARAGVMFSRFVETGHFLVMTANLRSSHLIERLAELSGRERMKVARMIDWTELTEVQRAEEKLFDEAHAKIEGWLG